MGRTSPFALLSTLGVIWGANFLFMKMALQVTPPLEVACLRTLFGALPILAYALLSKALAWSDWRSAHHFAVMAVLANVGPYVCFVVGTQHLPSGTAGVISGAIPCITAVIVALALPAETLTRRKIAGLAIGFAGVALVSRIGEPRSSQAFVLEGVGAMVLGSISYALAIVYARRFIAGKGLSAVKLAAYQMVIAFLLLSPFGRLEDIGRLLSRPGDLAALVLGLGLIGTGLAFVIYYQLIERLGALGAASVYYIPPAVALVLGAVFLQEPIGLLQVAGATAILAGIYLGSVRAEQAPPPVRRD